MSDHEPARAAEDRYRALVHHSVDVLAVLDATGVRRYLSPGVFALLGFRADELIGRSIFDLVHPEDLATAREAFAEVMTAPGAVARCEVRSRRADGGYIECEVIGCNQLGDAVLPGVILNIRDISERKREESDRLRLQRQLGEARKLETLGVLAGGLAHDFNNLMTSVLGYASLAGMQVTPGSPIAEYLAAIGQAAVRAADLCRQMLAYAGGAAMATEAVDLSAVVRAAGGLAGARLVLADDLPPIEADADLLRQVLRHLAANAVEAGGAVVVRTAVEDCSAEALGGLAGRDDAPAGRYVVLEVADAGRGMDAATVERVFDPFFSTKFLGRGLGLSAALGIVRSHGGVIEVRSAPGKGSTFRVYLPALPWPAL